MDIQALTQTYLSQQHMMQLATFNGTQPWICTVYFVYDASFNLYWMSLPSRRHSKELTSNPQVAAAIAIKFTNGEKVAGLQFEGSAKHIPAIVADRTIVQQYATRFNRTNAWVDDFMTGKTENQLYMLTPTNAYLFDDTHFPGGIPQKVV